MLTAKWRPKRAARALSVSNREGGKRRPRHVVLGPANGSGYQVLPALLASTTGLTGRAIRVFTGLVGKPRNGIWKVSRPTSAVPQPSPSQSLGHMQIRHTLSGRMERRLPIIVAVRLSRVRDLPTSEEVTYTDNVSVHGVRVVSIHSWLPGELAQIAPLQKEPSIQGEVVYCQSLGNKDFCVGFRFQEPVTWSALSRYGST